MVYAQSLRARLSKCPDSKYVGQPNQFECTEIGYSSIIYLPTILSLSTTVLDMEYMASHV